MAEKHLTQEKKDAAISQGDAYTHALKIMSGDVDVYQTMEAGDYIVTLAFEEAEGMYEPKDKDSLYWKVPMKNLNKHIEVMVQDKYDQRFVPELRVEAGMHDGNGQNIWENTLPFLWHPFIYHYGMDIEIPGEGDYAVSLTIDQPQFGRHDEENGKRYPTAIKLNFEMMHLKPGREPHGAE